MITRSKKWAKNFYHKCMAEGWVQVWSERTQTERIMISRNGYDKCFTIKHFDDFVLVSFKKRKYNVVNMDEYNNALMKDLGQNHLYNLTPGQG